MQTGSLFESTDLIREVATFLVDDADTLFKLACVSKTCHGAILGSPEIWKATCYRRWKSKWGFWNRWKKALLHEEPTGTWWRNAYVWQEIDATRNSITATELHSMTFDFRFWLSQYFGQGNLLSSGLRWTASQEFRFAPRQDGSSSSNGTSSTMMNIHDHNPTFLWPGQESGILKGHPSGRDDLEWFLHLDGQTMQWGKLPHLWPRGTVHRLETWGWEIRNPNVCLRAMDVQEVTNTNNEQGETTVLELVKNNGDDLWKDYCASLRRYPTDFGMPNEGIAFLEAPEEFWEFLQNRTRFPRLGIDEGGE